MTTQTICEASGAMNPFGLVPQGLNHCVVVQTFSQPPSAVGAMAVSAGGRPCRAKNEVAMWVDGLRLGRSSFCSCFVAQRRVTDGRYEPRRYRCREEHSAAQRPSASEQTVEGKTPPVPAFHFPALPRRPIFVSHFARCLSVSPSMDPITLALMGPMPQKARMFRSKLLRMWARKNHR